MLLDKVRISTDGNLIRIVDTVYDAGKAAADINQTNTAFGLDLKRDISFMPALFAFGDKELRKRFVPWNCPAKFLAPPFEGFSGGKYKTSQNFL